MMTSMRPPPLPEIPTNGSSQAYSFGPYLLRTQERRLLRNGTTVPAPPKVIETLILLVERSGEVVTKGELIDHVWPGVFVEEGNLAQNISHLRRIFREDFPDPGIILTVPKRGYSFTGEVHRQAPRAAAVRQEEPAVDEAPGVVPENDVAVEEPVDAVEFPIVGRSAEGVQTVPGPAGRDLKRLFRRPFSFFLVAVLLLFLLFALRTRGSRGVYASRPSVAILGFQNLSGATDAAWVSSALAENLQSDLSASESLRLVPGEVVLRAERELALPPTAGLSKASLERVHRDLDCDLVVVGSYLVTGGSIRLNLSVEDTVTGKVIGTYSHADDEDHLLSLIADTGSKLRQMLHVPELSQQSTEEVAASRETNPEALKLYNQGLQRLRLREGQGARELLQRAIELSPRSPLAHLAMSQAWSLEGYDEKAADEAKRAVALSKQLSRENQLRIQARLFETVPDWNKAAESYRALCVFFPDDREYGYLLTSALLSAGKPAEALQELSVLDGSSARPSPRPSPTEVDPRALLLQSDALNAEGQWQEGLSAAEEGAALAQSRGALILYENALANEATALGKLGQTEKEDATILEALRTANQVGDRFGSMTLLLHRAGALRRARNLDAALEVARQALDMSESIGARQRTVESLIVLGSTSRDRNDLQGSRQIFERALALAHELGSSKTAVVELNLANVENNLGEPAKARSLYVEALKDAEAVGDRGTQNIVHGNLGILDEAEGEPEEALKMLRLALAGNRAIAQKPSIAYDLGHVANVLLMEGDLAGARRTLDEQAAILPALGKGRGPEEQRPLRGEIALEEGRTEEARQLFEAALAGCGGDAGFCSSANRLLARLWLRRGDAARAYPYAVKSYDLTQTLKNPADYILPAMLQLAEADAALGRTGQARELFDAAGKQAQQLKLLPLELRARCGKAALQRKTSPVQAQSELRAIQHEATEHKLLLTAHHTAELLEQ